MSDFAGVNTVWANAQFRSIDMGLRAAHPTVERGERMLVWIACISLAVAFACAAVIAMDEARHPQKMGVMNVVWPVTALYLSVVGLWWYFRAGRKMTRDAGQEKREDGKDEAPPTWGQSLLAASHCGAGCALADVGVEFGVFALGLAIAGEVLWADYVWDIIFAWGLGIVFQYFTIKPMRDLSPGGGIVAAIKADTLSIIAFQLGMYAWMAVVYFLLFPKPHLEPVSPVYWLMMQAAMALGLLTATPMNRWLVRAGLKEKMG